MTTNAVSNISEATIQLIDAHTGATRHEASFIVRSAPGSDGDEFGSASWGFSPYDADEDTTATDARFVYAYVTGANSVQWVLVNLETGTVVRSETLLDIAAFWKFSPCGDMVALVTQPNQSQVNVRLFKTKDGGSVFSETFPLASVQLSSTEASHVVTVGSTTRTMAANTADDECPGGGGGTPNAPPAAGFDVPGQRRALLPVHFTDASTDSDGTIASWHWSFGDGSSSSEQSPRHAYAQPGTYTVTLRVTDDDDAVDTEAKTVTISPNEPPQASFTFAPPALVKRDVVTFTDTSTDDDGIASRTWSGGDLFSSDPVVSIKVCETFDVTLSVSDNAGQSDSETVTVEVGDSADVVAVPAGADLAEAVAAACPGDTLDLAAGTYRGGVELRGVSLSGAGPGETIIEGPVDGFVLTTRGPDPVSIEHLSIVGGGDELGQGGGVLADTNGLTRLADVEVAHNDGEGGIRIDDADAVEVHDSHIHHNANHGSDPGGGIGMFCCGKVTITDSEIAFNSAQDGGGAGPYEADEVVFTGNHVHDNTAEGEGGGLLIDSFGNGDVVAANRIVGNSAAEGGGMSIGSDVLVAGNLVAGNTGAGIYGGNHAGRVPIVNSTIVDNTGPGIVDSTSFDGFEFLIHNTILDGNAEVLDGFVCRATNNLVDTDPGFADGAYHLAAGSAAIDAGDDARVPALLATDGDGGPRIADGDGDGEATVDIGYDELGTALGAPGAGEADLAGCDPGLRETASRFFPGGGVLSTDTESDGATAADPVETSIAAEERASLSIDERKSFGSGSPLELWEVEIGVSGDSPVYTVRFDLDASVVPAGQGPETIGVRRGGMVAECAGEDGVAEPDPCVAAREALPGGDVRLTVLTTSGGVFDFVPGEPVDADGDGDGVADAADNCPAAVNPGQADADGDGTGDACDPSLLEDAAAPAPAGGKVTSDGEGDGASAGDPVETSVTAPVAGLVSIHEANAGPVDGFGLLGWTVRIEAPAATAANPLVLAFEIDQSLVPAGQTASTIQLLRNGTALPACSGAAGIASPDPCVSQRETQADGDVVLTALTSAASMWSFARTPDTDGDGALDSHDNCPAAANPGQADADGDGRGDACDDSGSGTGDGGRAGQPQPLGGQTLPATPALSKVRLARSVFRARKGTTLSFTLSRAATVVGKLAREAPGRRAGGKCDPKRKRGKRCTALVGARTLRFAGKTGETRVNFGKGFTRGQYRMTLTAHGTDGRTGGARVVHFRVR